MASSLRPRLLGVAATQVDLGLLILRLWFGLVMAFGHGIGKLTNLERFTAGVAQGGFPLPELLAPLAMLSEFAGGLLLAVGLLTRPACVFILLTMLGAALHAHAADPFNKKELAFCYAAVAIAVFLTGPGRYSLDALLARRLRNKA